MRILGLDPGTVAMGYGVICTEGDTLQALESGVLTAPRRFSRGDRLFKIHTLLSQLLERAQPDEMAIEEAFVGSNVSAALAIGEARGVAILAAAARGVPVHQYPPATVKSVVTGYGGGDKEQVRRMVSLQLQLAVPLTSTDASDALAVALCHAIHVKGRALLQGR